MNRNPMPANTRRPRARRLRGAATVAAVALVITGALPAVASAHELYTVQPGDTLAAIAQDQGLSSWTALFNANPAISDPDVIQVGQTLTIPSSSDAVRTRRASSSGSSASETTTSSAPSRSTASTGSSVWDALAACESGGNWSINTGNGYYGGLQFSLSSWQAVGGSGYPHEASRATQIAMGERLLAAQGWGAWPACSDQLGLR